MATCPTCRTRYPDDAKTCSADGEVLLPDDSFEPDLAVGQTVGEYRVEAKIGEGGFGSVYRAVHPLIGKAAAIKVLNKQYSSNPQMVSRFIAEARAVNQIRNRNIIDIFSFGALEDGRQYYVMELLDGSTLAAYIKQKGRLAPDEAMPILRGIARALDAAHATGIAHRDLKPENVFLIFEDDAVFPKLLDFGIAKLLGESMMSSHKTRTGTPMGTPHYMSPEQCRGRNVDHRTDIYSFGVLVFEALAGQVPFDGNDVMEILVKHTTAQAPRLSAVCPALPPGLDAPVASFLEKEPDKRPRSIGEGLDALAAAAADAGFDVKISGKRPGGLATPSARSGREGGHSHTPGTATPAENAALGGARTVLQPEVPARTVLSAASDVRPAAGGRGVLIGVAIAITAVAAAITAVAMRPKDPPSVAVPAATASATAAAVPATAQPVQQPVQTVTAVTGTPAITPSATAEVAAAEIELTLDTTPKAVDVYQGATKIGSSAAPIKIKRAEGKVKLTFKAAGYAPKDVDVSAAASATVSVTLAKVAAGRRSELEY